MSNGASVSDQAATALSASSTTMTASQRLFCQGAASDAASRVAFAPSAGDANRCASTAPSATAHGGIGVAVRQLPTAPRASEACRVPPRCHGTSVGGRRERASNGSIGSLSDFPARRPNQCASATPTATLHGGIGVTVNELPLASIAVAVPGVATRPSATVSNTAQTPPNTAPPTATRCGIGEGQHLHGAGKEQRAAHEPVVWRGDVSSVARAQSMTRDGCKATCCTSDGGLDGSADVQRADRNTLCIPTSPLVATVRPSDWQQSVITPKEEVVLRACDRAHPQGGAVGAR